MLAALTNEEAKLGCSRVSNEPQPASRTCKHRSLQDEIMDAVSKWPSFCHAFLETRHDKLIQLLMINTQVMRKIKKANNRMFKIYLAKASKEASNKEMNQQ